MKKYRYSLFFLVLAWLGLAACGPVATPLATGTPTGTREPAATGKPAGEIDLLPVDSITHQFPGNHLHGLGYDAVNDRLLLATHYGLFVLSEGGLYQLGASRDDFMGFSIHPYDPAIMYSSGHPQSGGNLGVMRSDDGGRTWRQLLRGLGSETVDFHSMSISAADPDRLYGAFQGRLYVTRDGGQTWQAATAEGLPWQGGLCWGVPCLATGSDDADNVYASTTAGLFRSQDGGESWALLTAVTGGVAGLAVDPRHPQRLLAFTQRDGVALSEDGGQSWQSRHNGFQLTGNEYVFGFAFHPADDQVLFAATTGGQIYRSQDGGASWQRQ
jgi:hypothetical protein